MLVPQDVLAEMGEGTLFFETVVAARRHRLHRHPADGDLALAQPVLDALRRQRFEPVQFRGRPVAVSVYRLISRMDVRSPVT